MAELHACLAYEYFNVNPCVCCLQEGQELELPTGFWVRPFATVHPVPSQVRQWHTHRGHVFLQQLFSTF
jgi:hypothetical protein